MTLSGCSDDEDYNKIYAVMGENMPSVTVVYSLSGPGDNGYNDMMVEGVVQFCDSANVALQTYQPESMEEARRLVDNWMDVTAGRSQRSLLVLVGNEYSSLASQLEPIDDKKRCILLVESEKTDMPNGVVTACVDRRGVMYLAGAMSSHTPAYIVAAMPGDNMVEPAIKAFCDGYETHGQGNKVEDIHYLSDDENGYSMLNEAYEYAIRLANERLEYSFTTGQQLDSRHIVLPLAGGSNTGIYFYSIQSYNEVKTFQAVIGMDVDYSGRLDMTPFSIVINVDDMLEDCISSWLKGRSLPNHRTYSMAEGYADIIINSSFNAKSTYAMQEFFWDDGYGNLVSSIDYLPADYWETRYNDIKKDAEEYEKNKLAQLFHE